MFIPFFDMIYRCFTCFNVILLLFWISQPQKETPKPSQTKALRAYDTSVMRVQN